MHLKFTPKFLSLIFTYMEKFYQCEKRCIKKILYIKQNFTISLSCTGREKSLPKHIASGGWISCDIQRKRIFLRLVWEDAIL